MFELSQTNYPLAMLVVLILLLGFRYDIFVGFAIGCICARGYFVALVPFDSLVVRFESSEICQRWSDTFGGFISAAQANHNQHQNNDQSAFVENFASDVDP